MTTASQETLATLHFVAIRHLLDYGHFPSNDVLAAKLSLDVEHVSTALEALQQYHGCVLHPHCARLWVVHPFSSSPTLFWVQRRSVPDENGERKTDGWWANCAWCAFGAAAILLCDNNSRPTGELESIFVDSKLGGEESPVRLQIFPDGRLEGPKNCVVHFPVPMVDAWDNVMYTCSVMLLFNGEMDVHQWCARHGVEAGDVRPIEAIWAMARDWYGQHLNPAWKKWSLSEAAEIFTKHGLTTATWKLPVPDNAATTTRF